MSAPRATGSRSVRPITRPLRRPCGPPPRRPSTASRTAVARGRSRGRGDRLKSLIRRCSCGRYTLEDICPECGG
ncbi:MAG TPA: hypothetical protein EYP43_01285, partial [Thermoplasmata archaeon]|nr:hypothetical protein [Thermoplasmata archaeon]